MIASGGTAGKEGKADYGIRAIVVYDPDGNSIVLREILK